MRGSSNAFTVAPALNHTSQDKPNYVYIAYMHATLPAVAKYNYYKLRRSILLLFILDPPLWSSGQSSWLQIQRSQVRSPVLPDSLKSSGSGTGSAQPREDN
jgi:hypothetical protein